MLAITLFRREEFIGGKAELFKEGAGLFFLWGAAFLFGQAELRRRDANLNIPQDAHNAEQSQRNNQFTVCCIGKSVAEEISNAVGKIQGFAF